MHRRLTRRSFVLATTILGSAISRTLSAWGRAGDTKINTRCEGTASPCSQDGSHRRGLIQPINYSDVKISDSFWLSKMEKVATTTLQACILYTEQYSGRIRNFEKAARHQGERHEGIFYDDSDVYKAIEAMAYSLKTHPDVALERKADEWIAKIAAAQQPDGYLNTYFTLTGLEGRWTDMSMHEDYCAGHLIEAAVAHYRTTGKRVLLDVAIRFADHLDTTFRVPDRNWVSGHEEIELALMKLHHLTHEPRYLRLATWYLEQRGRGFGRGQLWSALSTSDGRGPDGLDLDYCQDRMPVKQQRRIVGHAVRAMYLYSGTADVAAATGDADYVEAMSAVWKDVVYHNMYVTGGIGSSDKNEGFTRNYDLPNSQAYCETCASVGMVFWNYRMALLTGESEYVDVLERALYNGALDGIGLRGDRFFYGNPLASSAKAAQTGRSKWFGTACCPSNIARLVASVGGYFYAASARRVWVNLYTTSNTHVIIEDTQVTLEVTTQYPWDGKVRIEINPTQRTRFALHLRIPGWARATATPGDLYRFADDRMPPIKILLNEDQVEYDDVKGYAVIERKWAPGDSVELNLPMPVQQLMARTEVSADLNHVAFQRGPLVYCIEGADNKDSVWNFITSAADKVTTQPHLVLDENVVALRVNGSVLVPTLDGGGATPKPQTNIAIPYYTWANRENYDMQVWIPTKVMGVKIDS